MFRTLTSLFIFLLLGFQAKSEIIFVDGSKISNEVVKSMSTKDQWVYLFLTDICRNGSFPSFRDSISQSFKAGGDLWSLDPSRLQGYYKRGMTSTHIEAIFSSEATPHALENCFSHLSPEMKAERKNRLMFELMFWDYVGNHFGFFAGTVGIGRLIGGLFSALNNYAWKPFKNYAKTKFKLSDKQLKWLDGILLSGAIVVPAGFHVKDKYDEQIEAEEYEIAAQKRRLQNAKEVKNILVQIEIQIHQSKDKDFWIATRSSMKDQLHRLCREITQISTDHLSVDEKAICQN
ncbi:MAG: hypothetical protein ACK5V3_14300 [Bdellovibrionales bacterium]